MRHDHDMTKGNQARLDPIFQASSAYLYRRGGAGQEGTKAGEEYRAGGGRLAEGGDGRVHNMSPSGHFYCLARRVYGV